MSARLEGHKSKVMKCDPFSKRFDARDSLSVGGLIVRGIIAFLLE